MLIAAEYLGNVGVGVTAPQFFRADDGNIYIVKLQSNKLGLKVLVSEFLAARLGEFMGICFPPSDIIRIDEEMLQKDPLLIVLGVKAGRHFASQYMAGAEYVNKHNLSKAVNVGEMAGVMLFDHMFHNADRTYNRKNLIMRQEEAGYKIYAIDNSHLFRSGRWTIDSLKYLYDKLRVYYGQSFGTLLQECLTPQDFRPYLDKVANLTNEHIDNIVQEIPAEWLTDELERRELPHFIKKRRDMAEEVWNKLCNNIPKEHGGRRGLFGRVIRPRKKRLALVKSHEQHE